MKGAKEKKKKVIVNIMMRRIDQLMCTWMPIATIKMVSMQKNMMAWTKIAIPLVLMLPNSTTLYLAGNWNNRPGDKSMNKATATITGPQSAPISFHFSVSAAIASASASLFLLDWENKPNMEHVLKLGLSQ